MAVFIVLPLLFSAQSSFIKEAGNINTFIKADGSAQMNKIVSCTYGDMIFFIPQSVYGELKKGRYIYTYNTQNRKVDSILIEKSKKTNGFIKQRIFSMEATGDRIIILTDPSIITLSYNKNKTEYINSTKNTKFFNKIKRISNDECYLYVNYNFHPLDAPDRHVWAKFNLKTNSIEQVKKMDDNNALFTHFVNDWFSVYKGLIAYSNTHEYKIFFYNSNFAKIDSIVSNKLDSTKQEFEKMDILGLASKDDISNFMKKDESFKRIQKIFLLDSSHVLVMMKLPKSRKGEFDLWVKKNGKWELKKSELVENFYSEGKSYDQNNTPADAFFGNVNGIVYTGSFTFNVIYFPFLEDIFTGSFNNKNDYEEKLNNLVKTGQLYYGIKKYKILAE